MLIVAALMVQKLTKEEMALQLRLTAVKKYVMQILSVATFHTALNGKIVCFAPNAI